MGAYSSVSIQNSAIVGDVPLQVAPLKWVFSFNQGAEPTYGDLIRVAVQSARENTRLEAHCLYDGEPTPLTRWLEAEGVNIIPCRSRYYDDLARLSQVPGQAQFLQIGAGAFLRMELAQRSQELGWTDRFVLYTDCDVVFLRDPAPLLRPLRPRYFAATPEASMRNLLYLNTGVMWMNLPHLRRVDDHLTAFTRQHLGELVHLAWDQGAYRVYFHPLHRLAFRIGVSRSLFYGLMSRIPLPVWAWSSLPVVLNWKTYWGIRPDVTILHFHGPKPQDRERVRAGKLAPFVQCLVRPELEHWYEVWDEYFARAKPLSP